jgi:hypothetical protein
MKPTPAFVLCAFVETSTALQHRLNKQGKKKQAVGERT